MRDDPVIATRSRQKIASENRAELEGWIDERAAELVKEGVLPDEARRRALAEFGDIATAERYAEQQDVAADRRVRAVFWIEEFFSDLRIALRTLSRTPSVTAVVLLTFALGVGATTALREGAHVALFGALLGVPLALLLASSIRSLLYSIAPFDPLTISAVLAALFGVEFAASLVPARLATHVDPAGTMRTD